MQAAPPEDEIVSRQFRAEDDALQVEHVRVYVQDYSGLCTLTAKVPTGPCPPRHGIVHRCIVPSSTSIHISCPCDRC